MADPLKVCFAASEVAPFAKTGGLADVAAALPRELHRRGHDLRVFLPFYDTIPRDGVWDVEFVRDVPLTLGSRTAAFSLRTTRLPGSELWIHLVDCPEVFHRGAIYTGTADDAARFAYFSRAVVESCQRMGFAPDVFHCNDWHTALIPLLLRGMYDWDALFRATRTVLTIHNVGYQGSFPAAVLGELGLGHLGHLFDQTDLRAGRVSFLRAGLMYADLLTTVSPTHAREIQTDEMGLGMADLLRARSSRLIGILNGVDYGEWSPETDAWLVRHYSAATLDDKIENKRHLLRELRLPERMQTPLVGMITRLAPQKGIELALEVLPAALQNTDLMVAVLGSGEARYERGLQALQQAFPGRMVFYRGYSEQLAHLIEAGADMFLMPSLYEPCGLNQMFSLRYGTIPIVRRTGGLADSVHPFDPESGEGTGFVFEHYDARGLTWALGRALATWRDRRAWRRLQLNAMAQDFSWETQAARYVELYRWLAAQAG